MDFAGRGEQVAREDSYCEIDPERRGQVGHPGAALPSHVERLRAPAGKHMQETFRRSSTTMGGTPTSAMPGVEQNYGLAVGGLIIHEAGAVRMGDDAKTSALNRTARPTT